MAVSNDTIIKKMIQELYQAKEDQHSHKRLVEHIANVRLLCDLFLEEDTSIPVQQKSVSESEFTQAEIKAMLGEQAGGKILQQKQEKKSIDHEEANGDSIFDF